MPLARGSKLYRGLKRSMENAKQLHEKKGPFYERWLAGMKRWSDSIGERRRK